VIKEINATIKQQCKFVLII